MKKYLLLGLGCLLVLLVSAVANMPARIINWLPLPAQLTVEGASGTVWNGQAQSVAWQGQNFGQLQWKLSVWKLFTAKAEAQVRFGRGSDMGVIGRGVVGYKLSGPYVENLVASLPVNQLMPYLPPIPVPLDLDGQLELTVKSLNYAAPYCHDGEGTLVWNTQSLSSPMGELQVGPVVADINCKDSVIDVKGSQQSDQVSSGFSATLQSNKRYKTHAWFKPEQEFPQNLSSQLKWLKPNRSGQYEFDYDGRF